MLHLGHLNTGASDVFFFLFFVGVGAHHNTSHNCISHISRHGA